MTDCHPHHLIHYLSPLSSSSINTCSTPAVVFNDISINSGLAAGEFRPVLHINSKSLVVTTQASELSHRIYYSLSDNSRSFSLTNFGI
ncbi:MAG TPA: hypothetical protein VJ799_05085 [Nitrososphaeraceae archaeon]|nr:hypothetical protein [Nitrososphaeraceae archaeon]